MNITKLIRDLGLNSWDNLRAVSLVGPDALIADAVDRIVAKDSERVIMRIWPKTSQDLFDAVSQHDVDSSPRTIIAYGAGTLFKETDLPKVTRLLMKSYHNNRVVVTGNTPISDEDIAAQFKRSTMSRTFLLSFSTTDTGRNQFAQWVGDVSGLPPRASFTVAHEVGFDVSRAYNVARKAAAFSEPLDIPSVKILATDFGTSPFANSLLMLRPAEAMRAAETFPIRTLPMVLDNMAKTIRTLGQIYPLTRQAKTPGKQQIIDSRLPLKTLERWWGVAGRYSPSEQLRRQLLIAETSHLHSYNKEYRGVLENMVVSW